MTSDKPSRPRKNAPSSRNVTLDHVEISKTTSRENPSKSRKKPLALRPPKPPPLTDVQRLWALRAMLANACAQVQYLEQEMNEASRLLHATIALQACKHAKEALEATWPTLRKIAKEQEYAKDE